MGGDTQSGRDDPHCLTAPPWTSERAIKALKTLRTAKLLSTGKDRVRRRKTAVGLKDEFAIAGLGSLGINDLRGQRKVRCLGPIHPLAPIAFDRRHPT